MEFMIALCVAWLLTNGQALSEPWFTGSSRSGKAARGVVDRVKASRPARTPRPPKEPRPAVTATAGGWVSQRVGQGWSTWKQRRADNWRAGWQEGKGLARGRLPGETEDPPSPATETVDPPPAPAGGDGAATGTDPTNPTATTPGPTGTGKPVEGEPAVSAPAPTVGTPSSSSGPSPSSPGGGGSSTGRGGGVAAAEFTVQDLLALTAKWAKEAEFARAHMEAGKMGTETVNGLAAFQEAANTFKGTVNRVHGGLRAAVNDAPVVGQSDRYIDR